MWSQLVSTFLPLLSRLFGKVKEGVDKAKPPSRYDTSRWSFRRKWFVVFGITGVVCLVGSVAADAFLRTNITMNVFEPVCILLGVNLGSYIWGRNTDAQDGS